MFYVQVLSLAQPLTTTPPASTAKFWGQLLPVPTYRIGGVKGTLPKVAALYRWEYGYLVFPVLSSTLHYSVVLSIFLMVKESERFLYVATILSQNSQL